MPWICNCESQSKGCGCQNVVNCGCQMQTVCAECSCQAMECTGNKIGGVCSCNNQCVCESNHVFICGCNEVCTCNYVCTEFNK